MCVLSISHRATSDTHAFVTVAVLSEYVSTLQSRLAEIIMSRVLYLAASSVDQYAIIATQQSICRINSSTSKTSLRGPRFFQSHYVCLGYVIIFS